MIRKVGANRFCDKLVGYTTSATIKPFIRDNLQINSNIYTDGHRSYINKLCYKHSQVEYGKK